MLNAPKLTRTPLQSLCTQLAASLDAQLLLTRLHALLEALARHGKDLPLLHLVVLGLGAR